MWCCARTKNQTSLGREYLLEGDEVRRRLPESQPNLLPFPTSTFFSLSAFKSRANGWKCHLQKEEVKSGGSAKGERWLESLGGRKEGGMGRKGICGWEEMPWEKSGRVDEWGTGRGKKVGKYYYGEGLPPYSSSLFLLSGTSQEDSFLHFGGFFAFFREKTRRETSFLHFGILRRGP